MTNILVGILITIIAYNLSEKWKEEVKNWIKSNTNIVIEVKDNIGNTICAISVKNNKIDRNFKCSVAEKKKDYMFGTKSKLVVIQTCKNNWIDYEK